MTNKGTCEKHGEFDLIKGCPQCMAERDAGPGGPGANTYGEPIRITEELLEETAAETALALRPGEDVEVMSYYIEAVKLQQYAEARVIATVEDVKIATDDLSIIARLKKAMEGKKREYLDPLKVQMDDIRGTYNSLMAPIEAAYQTTRDKMTAFKLEQQRKAQEAEELK